MHRAVPTAAAEVTSRLVSSTARTARSASSGDLPRLAGLRIRSTLSVGVFAVTLLALCQGLPAAARADETPRITWTDRGPVAPPCDPAGPGWVRTYGQDTRGDGRLYRGASVTLPDSAGAYQAALHKAQHGLAGMIRGKLQQELLSYLEQWPRDPDRASNKAFVDSTIAQVDRLLPGSVSVWKSADCAQFDANGTAQHNAFVVVGTELAGLVRTVWSTVAPRLAMPKRTDGKSDSEAFQQTILDALGVGFRTAADEARDTRIAEETRIAVRESAVADSLRLEKQRLQEAQRLAEAERNAEVERQALAARLAGAESSPAGSPPTRSPAGSAAQAKVLPKPTPAELAQGQALLARAVQETFLGNPSELKDFSWSDSGMLHVGTETFQVRTKTVLIPSHCYWSEQLLPMGTVTVAYCDTSGWVQTARGVRGLNETEWKQQRRDREMDLVRVLLDASKLMARPLPDTVLSAGPAAGVSVASELVTDWRLWMDKKTGRIVCSDYLDAALSGKGIARHTWQYHDYQPASKLLRWPSLRTKSIDGVLLLELGLQRAESNVEAPASRFQRP